MRSSGPGEVRGSQSKRGRRREGSDQRSGAAAMGLSAINCYMGMRWNENTPEDFVKYTRNDLMGLVREVSNLTLQGT